MKGKARVWRMRSLAVLIGVMGLLVRVPPPVVGQTNPPQSAQQSAELEEALRLNEQAVQLSKQGQYTTAIPLAERSLAIYEKVLGKEHPDVAVSFSNLAALYQTQGDISRALEFLNRGTNIQEHNLALIFTIGSEAQKSAYIATLSGTTDATVSLHVQAAPNNPQAVSPSPTAYKLCAKTSNPKTRNCLTNSLPPAPN